MSDSFRFLRPIVPDNSQQIAEFNELGFTVLNDFAADAQICSLIEEVEKLYSGLMLFMPCSQTPVWEHISAKLRFARSDYVEFLPIWERESHHFRRSEAGVSGIGIPKQELGHQEIHKYISGTSISNYSHWMTHPMMTSV